jgi:hypothetical protein
VNTYFSLYILELFGQITINHTFPLLIIRFQQGVASSLSCAGRSPGQSPGVVQASARQRVQ